MPAKTHTAKDAASPRSGTCRISSPKNAYDKEGRKAPAPLIPCNTQFKANETMLARFKILVSPAFLRLLC